MYVEDCQLIETVKRYEIEVNRLLELYNKNTWWMTKESREFSSLKKQIIGWGDVVDFLNECEEQDYDLDADDIRHILKEDFDYVRKQEQIEEDTTLV